MLFDVAVLKISVSANISTKMAKSYHNYFDVPRNISLIMYVCIRDWPYNYCGFSQPPKYFL
jgi:hypothetical protein